MRQPRLRRGRAQRAARRQYGSRGAQPLRRKPVPRRNSTDSRQIRTQAETISMTLSIPKATSRRLWAAMPEPIATAVSTIIQMTVSHSSRNAELNQRGPLRCVRYSRYLLSAAVFRHHPTSGIPPLDSSGWHVICQFRIARDMRPKPRSCPRADRSHFVRTGLFGR